MKKNAIRISTQYKSTYYLFPDEFNSIDDFVKYLDVNPNHFIKLIKFSEKTRYPYFIEEENEEVYLRLDQEVEIQSVEATMLKREEYIARLIKLVDTVCVGCGGYSNEKDSLGEIGNLKGHWGQISLDGFCDLFWRKDTSECK